MTQMSRKRQKYKKRASPIHENRVTRQSSLLNYSHIAFTTTNKKNMVPDNLLSLLAITMPHKLNLNANRRMN